MNKGGLEIMSKTALVLLVSIMLFYLFYSTANYGETFSEKQTQGIEEIINKALVQCYALEGGYPEEVEYVEKYGVIFDNDKYLYHYEWYGSNLRPSIVVIEK